MGNAILDPLRGYAALERTFAYFAIHIVFVIVLSSIMTILSFAKLPAGPPAEGWKSWISSKFTSALAFGTLGFAVAYLLSLGVDKNGGTNSLLTTIATPMVPLLTGGITFLETAGGNTDVRPRTGMIAFLVAFAVCYQTFYYQISHLWPS